MLRETFVEKSQIIHKGKYSYYFLPDKFNTKEKVKLLCPVHGEFFQTPDGHLQGYGCAKCGVETVKNKLVNKTEEFIKKAKETHGDNYDYSQSVYVNNKTPITIVCKEHNRMFTPTPNNHIRGTGCPVCAGKLRTGRPSKTTKTFIEDANRIHCGLYDYHKVLYKTAFVNVIITCKEHGDFEQLPNNHLQGRGCPKCGWDNRVDSRTLTTEEFVLRASEIHNGYYDYSKVDYKNARLPVTIICPNHGEFSQVSFEHLKGSGCPKCATVISKPHKLVLSWLEGEEVTSNDRKILGGKELDIYLPEYKLGIEIHGLYWHSSQFVAKTYHRDKLDTARKAGITLIQFWDAEVLNKPELVRSMILSRIGKSANRIFARKCVVREVSSSDYSNFLKNNHIQGEINSNTRKGLFYNDELISVMGITKRGQETHLDRFCTLVNTTVVGGFNKLLSSVELEELVSFSDNRYSEGNVYEKSGFKFEKENKFTLHYTDNVNILPRHRFMRHKLEEEFGKKFPDTMTAEEICASQGIYQLWGPGTKKWVYSQP